MNPRSDLQALSEVKSAPEAGSTSPKRVRAHLTHVGLNPRLVCACTRFLTIWQMLYSPEALNGSGGGEVSLQSARCPPRLSRSD